MLAALSGWCLLHYGRGSDGGIGERDMTIHDETVVKDKRYELVSAVVAAGFRRHDERRRASRKWFDAGAEARGVAKAILAVLDEAGGEVT